MPRTKRKDSDLAAGTISRMLPAHVTLVKRSEGQSGPGTAPDSAVHSGDWPTLNLSGGEWDGHPFAPSGMSSGHSQASSGARRFPSETADPGEWPNLVLASPSVRPRAPATGVLATSEEEDVEEEDEDEEEEWDGSVPTFEVSSSAFSRTLSVMKSTAASSESPATTETTAEESSPSGEAAATAGERFLAQLPPSMGSRVKLVDVRGQMMPGESTKGVLPFLRPDGVNYLVVGVLGHAGVGKSALLNWLVNGALPMPSRPGPGEADGEEVDGENGVAEEEEERADSSVSSGSGGGGIEAREEWDRGLRGSLRAPVFPTQTLGNLLSSHAQTQGVDVFVTPMERLILLDTQPINSTCACADLVPNKSGSTSGPPSSGSGEEAGGGFNPGSEASSLRMASFLLSVCHAVVVVAEDSPVDVELLNFVHTATMLKPSILVGANASSAAKPAAQAGSARQKAEEEEPEEEEEADEEEAGEEEGEKTANGRMRRKRTETGSAAQTDYMAHVFWVMNKVETAHQWQGGRAGADWLRLMDDTFRVRPPTEVSLPPPPSVPPGPPAGKDTAPETPAGDEAVEEATEEAREGGRSRHESEASARPGGKSEPVKKEERRRRKEEVCGSPVEEKESERRQRVFCLPLLLPAEERQERESAFESRKWLEEEFEANARALMRELLALPRHHMQSPQAAFTERKWLKFSKELWESIPSSPLFSDYNGLIV